MSHRKSLDPLTIESINKDASSTVIDEDKHQVHPAVWISLSLFVALTFAFGNSILSLLSKYQFHVLELESPSGWATNLISLLIIMYINKSKELEDSSNQNEISFFDSIYQIYYYGYDVNIPEQKVSIHWSRIFLTFLVALLHILQHWVFILGYYYASLANLNNGIVMTILASKPFFSSVAFYFLFNQRLEKFELIAMGILLISVILIGFSSDESNSKDNHQNTIYIIISMLLLVVSTFLVSIRIVLIKYFLAHGENQADISVFSNIYSFIQNLIMLIVLIVHICYGFTFSLVDFLLAQTTGILWTYSIFIIVYVNLRGKAGTSDALIETWVVYQTILDAIFFGRIPNIIQIIAIIIGFSATLIIVFGYQRSKKTQEEIEKE